MGYVTMEVEIDHGRVIPKEPEKLPVNGWALLTVLEARPPKPDWQKIEPLLGTLKTDLDAVEWQRRIRSEWDTR